LSHLSDLYSTMVASHSSTPGILIGTLRQAQGDKSAE